MKNICYESTGECNLQCDYCISSDNQKSKEQKKDYKEIINTIVGFHPQRIVISGGEPLLDKDLLDKLSIMKEKCPEAYLSISTNGAVDSYDFSQLAGYIDCLDFSLPALDGNIYKEMRGQNCVEKVKANIKKAGEQPIELRLSYTLTKVNKEELPKILKFAEEMHMVEVRIGRFFPFREADSCKEKYELSEDEIKIVMDSIQKEKYAFRIVPPTMNLENMEKGYLTINYLGEIFLPSREGKKIIAKIEDLNHNDTHESVVGEIDAKQRDIFIHTNMVKTTVISESATYIQTLLQPHRIRASEYQRSSIEEYYSDRSRILYSQPFRRLQQKAQVFSLEKNSSVRSRLSHSLEVSDVGRLMAQKITQKMIDELPASHKYHLDREDADKIISIVENAGLMHDLGNPPFGHFGEAAIRKWWDENYLDYIDAYNVRARKQEENAIAFTTKRQQEILCDFKEFDGNPQGIRTVLRFNHDEVLDKNNDKYESGMNLTYQTVLSCVKYIRCAGEKSKPNISKKLQKKIGYFQTEKAIIQSMQAEFSRSDEQRFPFVYIMEAADDIAYCMSDVADGIEKGLTTLKAFMEELEKMWKEKYHNKSIPETIIKKEMREKISNEDKKDINIDIIPFWASKLTEIAVNRFINNIADFMEGRAESVFPHMEDATEEEKPWCRLLETLGEYARKKIYRASEAESIEIAGYSIIKGLMDNFGKLLMLTKADFDFLLNPSNNPRDKNLDVESRYFHLLGDKYIQSYKNQLKEWNSVLLEKAAEGLSEEQIEWWLRAHMIIDHISGMTDQFALETYQLCKGISIGL